MSLLLISPEPVQKGFAVDLEQVVVLVSTFSRTFEELSSCSEFKFTGLFHIYSIHWNGD